MDVTPGALIKAIRSEHARLDERVEAMLARSIRPLSCRIGCDACCQYPVRVEAWEVSLLASAFHSLPLLEQRQVRRGTQRALKRLRPLRKRWSVFPEDDASRIAYCRRPVPCPLLAGRRCVLYAERPVACRTHFVVSDPALCKGGDRPVTAIHLDGPRRELLERLDSAGVRAPGEGVLLVDALERIVRGSWSHDRG